MSFKHGHGPGAQGIVHRCCPVLAKGSHDIFPRRIAAQTEQDFADFCNQWIHLQRPSAWTSVLGIENRRHAADPMTVCLRVKPSTPLPRVGFTPQMKNGSE